MSGTVGLMEADRRWRGGRTCKRSRKASSQREGLCALLSGTGEGDSTRRELKEKGMGTKKEKMEESDRRTYVKKFLKRIFKKILLSGFSCMSVLPRAVENK